MPTVLYTGGTFDLLHFGHANFLSQCKRLADHVIVSLNTDEFILRYKKVAPILNFEERKASLLHLPYVDEVIANIGDEDSKPAILKADPDIIAIGDDWAKRDYYKQMGFTQKWLDERDIILLYLPYTRGISTSELKMRVLQEIEATKVISQKRQMSEYIRIHREEES